MLATSKDGSKCTRYVMNATVKLDAARSPRGKPNGEYRRPLVYVTRRIPQAGIDTLLETCNVRLWDSELLATEGELLANIVGVDGILCMPGDIISCRVLDAAGSQLRVVATVSHDSGHIDEGECRKRSIQIITCPLLPTEILPEMTIALGLLTIKKSQTEDERESICKPQPPDLISRDFDVLTRMNELSPLHRKRVMEEQLAYQFVSGKPLNTECATWRKIAKMAFGIYGLTDLGLKVADILKDIGIGEVVISDTDTEQNSNNDGMSRLGYRHVSVDELLKTSDVVCVCGSAGNQGKEFFSRSSFEAMKKDAVFIVSQSQEGTVNYIDLYMALRHGQIKAAGLNDCNQKPVPYKSLFSGLQNCIFLPQTQESACDVRHKVSVCMAQGLIDALMKTRNLQTLKPETPIL